VLWYSYITLWVALTFLTPVDHVMIVRLGCCVRIPLPARNPSAEKPGPTYSASTRWTPSIRGNDEASSHNPTVVDDEGVPDGGCKFVAQE